MLRALKGIVKYGGMGLVLFALAFLGYFKLYGNFHKVDDDVYRSAQLFSFNMPYYVKEHHIRSIINLRGEKPHKAWYRDEVRMSQELNVTHYDLKLSANRSVSMKEMEHLISLMRQAPKPLLIHCRAGADRTSLAVALYRYAIKHDPHAEDSISLLYGHFPWLWSRTGVMDESFSRFVHKRKIEGEEQ